LDQDEFPVDDVKEDINFAMFYLLHPEVCGGIGPHTIMDRSTHPPVVHHLHYVFEAYEGEHLVEGFPCYLVSAPLEMALERSHLRGFSFGAVEVSKSPDLESARPQSLPAFRRLLVSGVPKADDFGITDSVDLIVSQAALDLLLQGHLLNCPVEVCKD
jgi:hypothetical protein